MPTRHVGVATAAQANARALAREPKPWDAAAGGWDAHSDAIHNWLSSATEQMLDAANIGPRSRVLDIAAGAGDQTLSIAARVGSNGYVLATDISAPLLSLARARIRAMGYAQVNTRVLDAQYLGLQGRGFDAAVSRMGLMFCKKPDAALANARAALRRGGRYSALVFAGPERNPCVATCLRVAHQHRARAKPAPEAENALDTPGGLLSLGMPGLMERLLVEAGFKGVDVVRLAAPFCMPSVQHYMRFVRQAASPIIELLAPLREREREAAWQDMETQLQPYTGSQAWVGPNELLLCVGTAP
jgi:SAM-dependent methyltransferase